MMARGTRMPRLPLPSASWPLPLALVTVAAMGACSPRALVEVDVVGDAPFQNVTLQIAAGAASKSFARASFTADTAFKAGLFVDSASSTVVIIARALDSGGSCIGIGVGSAMDVSGGNATAPVRITVAHSSSCVSPPTGGGTGGGTGAGTGGTTTDGVGGNATGTGGAGTGTGGSNNGGVGGATGSGGATGGGGATNLITNGDFSNGENSWAIKMGSGTISISTGAYCIAISSGATLTVGYPAGATAPFQITAGMSYRFSYQASVSANNTMIEARVGQTQTPYDATGSDWLNEPVSASLQTFTHTFTRGATDSMMGVAFNLAGGPSTFCIDNVTLTPN
jgi:hypothetical protein